MYIPNDDIIKIGDRVELLHDHKLSYGTYTKGHQFTVTDETERGFDLIDDDGRQLTEIGPFVVLIKIKPIPNSSKNYNS